MFIRIVFIILLFLPVAVNAQFNTDRLVTIGRSALYYEDYVLSIQYFNQAINAKPYLYEPWFYRGVAKYYLADYAGAEQDCSEAIKRNPYVVGVYELRGLTRIQQDRFDDAVDDYTKALKYDPENKNLWHNRILCRMENKDYVQALADLDTMLTRWSKYAKGYSMQADIYLRQEDTVAAIKAIDRSIEIDPYDGNTWQMKAVVRLKQSRWKEADECLGKAIHLKPKNAELYINRALARININNLRGAMSDYDIALDLEPDNFLGHYNRGLLRSQVGDDNRAITDFDFVLQLEPENVMALFNRALLLDKTGDLRGAVRDYSKVISKYPNFWTGLHNRASCYRRMGMNKQAEADEMRVYKAQLYKSLYGRQPRLNKSQMRKWGDVDPDKYNQLAVSDEEDTKQEYKNSYRGKVQNRKVDMAFLPMFELSFENTESEVHAYNSFDKMVDEYNRTENKNNKLYVNTGRISLDEKQSGHYFMLIDSIGDVMQTVGNDTERQHLLFKRAVAYTLIQNFESAVADLSEYIEKDSTTSLAYWQRAVCLAKINEFNASLKTEADGKAVVMSADNIGYVLSDFEKALKYDKESVYLYYNIGNVHALKKDYLSAISCYTKTIELDGNFAEAYYNRGVAEIHAGNTAKGISDLSKAGELGLYSAYSIIKKYGK
ncbi:tetratricopeptide repeat protein [Xylanibacter muris]|uniref:Tetratricopeptide repeat protein n=1 Tax=Xylanibacter muris TaxID=2736290 RepID=A0ABX2AJZ4_9BACT|nr:tetratricopeptide repeat protein [Xylanibacter muris]NPD91344.1 tetratricopeptide repeat protein [Xylanibacter muris]